MIGFVSAAVLAAGISGQYVGDWIQLPSMPRPLGKVAAATDGTEVLVVGEVNDKEFQETFLFDIATKQWVNNPSDNKHNFYGGYHGAITVEGADGLDDAYLFGGRGGEGDDSKEVCNNAQVYNHDTDTWESLKALNVCTSQPALAYREGYIHMCGGYDEDAGESSAKCYDFDIANQSWADDPIVPHLAEEYKFWGAAACYHKLSDTFYIIGGHKKEGIDEAATSTDLGTVATFKFGDSAWKYDDVEPLKTPRGELGAAICTDNYIYVIGGAIAADDVVSDEVSILDVSQTPPQWMENGPPLKHPAEVYPVLLGNQGYILVAGGESKDERYLKEAYMLQLKENDSAANELAQFAQQNVIQVGESSSGGGRSTGEKIGIAIGVILLIVAVFAGAFFGWRYYQSRKNLTFSKYDDTNPATGQAA